MSFFKKLTETVTKGVSTATEKAQQTVEITKLHSQIAGKRKEIERKYNEIGEAVYRAYLDGDLSKAETDVIPACQQIADKNRDIDSLEDRIRELRNEKECECGQRVPFQTRFCPACGKPFPEPVAPAAAGESEGQLSALSSEAAPERVESAIEVYPADEAVDEAWDEPHAVGEGDRRAYEGDRLAYEDNRLGFEDERLGFEDERRAFEDDNRVFEKPPEKPVVHICTACQAEMPEEARFCQDCGNPMYP